MRGWEKSAEEPNPTMFSYVDRHGDEGRAMVLMAPGWIRTEMSGPDAPFDIEDVMRQIADVLNAQQEIPGLRYFDRNGETVPR